MFQSEIIIPVGYYILFSGSLVHGGSKSFVQNKEKYPNYIILFFIIAENKYKHDVCEMTHNLTKMIFVQQNFPNVYHSTMYHRSVLLIYRKL